MMHPAVAGRKISAAVRRPGPWFILFFTVYFGGIPASVLLNEGWVFGMTSAAAAIIFIPMCIVMHKHRKKDTR